MISRVSDVLGAYQHDERSMTVSELGRRTGIPKASMSRIASDMVGHGLLERDGDQLRLGIRLFELGQQASRPTDLRKLAFPHMSELMKATGQTVHLAVLDGVDVVYIQILRSRFTPPLPSRVGGRLPARATGVGKVLLSYAPSSLIDEICSAPMTEIGPHTVTDPARFRREIEAVRTNRVAYEREEAAANVGCAAAPILGRDGLPVAAISVSVHLNITDLSKMGPAVSAVGMALSREAGRTALRSTHTTRG